MKQEPTRARVNKWQGCGRASGRLDDLEDLKDLDNLDPVSDEDTIFMCDRKSYVAHDCCKNSQRVKVYILVTRIMGSDGNI